MFQGMDVEKKRLLFSEEYYQVFNIIKELWTRFLVFSIMIFYEDKYRWWSWLFSVINIIKLGAHFFYNINVG